METFETATVRIIEHYLSGLHTALPAKVLRVNDGASTSVDVLPLIKLAYADGTTTDRAILQDIPVMKFCTGSSVISMPIAEGDTVLLVFSMRNIENFKEGDGNSQEPADFRQFAAQDAVAIPGLFPKSIHPVNDVSLADSKSLYLAHNVGKPTEVVVELTEAGEAILKKDETNYVKVSQTGVEIMGILTINGVPYVGHTHSGVTTGPGVSGPVVV